MLDEKRNGFSLSERGLASVSDRRDLHRFGIYLYRFYQLRAVSLEDVSCNESLCVVDTVGLTGRSEASLRRSNGLHHNVDASSCEPCWLSDPDQTVVLEETGAKIELVLLISFRLGDPKQTINPAHFRIEYYVRKSQFSIPKPRCLNPFSRQEYPFV